MNCPSEETAIAFVDKTLGSSARQAVLEHVDRCEDCRTIVSELVHATAPTAPSAPCAPDLEAAERRIGRYVVQDVLGCGAMGIVYAGRDPELDREVAIKVMLQVGERDRDATEGRQQLIDEARAMARIAHPNVVHVYDVGTLGDRVFVTMERVDGRTLRDWTAERRRGWRDVVDTWVLAGRGLAAAHAAGLVHGDFKPDNVLVGHDGQVRVTDFGLARGVVAPGDPASLGGTPAYMAPEQLRRRPVDHHTDQWSFCVSLYEGLYGKRPFDGDSITEFAENVRTGRLVATNQGHVPSSVQKIVLRGLSVDPAERYPSMPALLEDLERALGKGAPRARRQRAFVLAAAAFAVIAASSTLARVYADVKPGDAEEQLAQATAAETSQNWEAMRVASVAAAAKTRRPALVARARVTEAVALAKLERFAEAKTAAEDGRERYRRLDDNSGLASAWRALAVAQAGAGDTVGALASFDRAGEIARARGDRALLLETEDQAARVLTASGKLAAAVERDDDLVRLARELDLPAIVVASLRRRAGNLTELGRLSEAAPLWEEVTSLLRARGDEREVARVTASAGMLFLERTDLEAAREHYEVALAAARSLHDPRSEALSLAGLAAVYEYQGDLRRARALYEEWMALAMRLELGSFAKIALATLAMEEGRFADAEGLVGAVGRSAENDRRPAVAAVVAAADATLAWALVEQGKIEAATEAITRARLGVRGSEVQRLRLHVATIGAVVDGFSGEPARVTAAFAALSAIDEEAAASGAVRAALWARYARGRLEVRLGRPEGRGTLEALAKSAAERKMGTIARLASDRRTATR